MAKRILSLLLLLNLMLPMGIGLAHAFHSHDSNMCLAVDENHIHQEKTDCDQLHYFSQTLNHSDVDKLASIKAYWSTIDQGVSASLIIINLDETDPDRGPPFFNVL